jgi:hypothetical protein
MSMQKVATANNARPSTIPAAAPRRRRRPRSPRRRQRRRRPHRRPRHPRRRRRRRRPRPRRRRRRQRRRCRDDDEGGDGDGDGDGGDNAPQLGRLLLRVRAANPSPSRRCRCRRRRNNLKARKARNDGAATSATAALNGGGALAAPRQVLGRVRPLPGRWYPGLASVWPGPTDSASRMPNGIAAFVLNNRHHYNPNPVCCCISRAILLLAGAPNFKEHFI